MAIDPIMPWKPTGRHLIAGTWTRSGRVLRSTPWMGSGHDVAQGNEEDVVRAARAAKEAFETFAAVPAEGRATLLEAIASSIDGRGNDITRWGHAETALPEQRLEAERARTIQQLRLFADHIRRGAHLGLRHDAADPYAVPPRPDLHVLQCPVGPVAVFGASNFPLAFSVAGGDTASALAAGCPVIVKGHEAHPATSELVAGAIREALDATGLPQGIFSLLQGEGRVVGAALVQHPLIRAVGFTGSLRAGRALFDLCAARPAPIPFFGELGSVNPVFLLPGALTQRGDTIAEGWVASLTMGAGQFCTNPGVIVLHEASADAFVARVGTAIANVSLQPMLTDAIAAAYRTGSQQAAGSRGVRVIHDGVADGREAGPVVLRITAADWLVNETLHEEVFGPMGIVITVRDDEEMLQVARTFAGQLVGTLHLEESDIALARKLIPVLERMAGRVLANGFPTGVAVADAMVHGGPWPASTNFGHTSVGTLSIRRWQRAMCWQDMPDMLLPSELRMSAMAAGSVV